jgi:pimeloyl-ACP methyl ester carboxylesterase
VVQIKANGINLEYDETGPKDGVPLLLIMGFGAQMTAWTPLFREALAGQGLRVIRFDNRDVGLSQRFEGSPNPREVLAAMAEGRKPDVPYTLNDLAADAAGLLHALGIDSAHILGASMGGMIAQLVAINHPRQTRSLISVFSSTGDPSLPRTTPEAQAVLLAPPPSTRREDVVAHSVKNRKFFASTRWPTDDASQAELIGAAYDRSFDPKGVARQYAGIMATPPRTEALKSLQAPALVLHGTKDTLIDWRAGLHTAECIPHSEFVLLDGWGHDVPAGGVPTLVDYIASFIRRTETARSKAA